jgi:uracil-DNA glycosylase
MQSLFSSEDFEIDEWLKIKSLELLFSEFNSNSGWGKILEKFSKTDDFRVLEQKLIAEYGSNTCFPERKNVLKALRLTPLEDVRVVILGQDPYHAKGQADGLSFSVPKGLAVPPSLRNILKERTDDLGLETRSSDLSDLASQGVLLLNTVLTVTAAKPASHSGWGWELLVEMMLDAVNELPHGVCFILWGKHAEKFKARLDVEKHKVFSSPHPSPLSSYRGFFGSKPFSNVNNALIELGSKEINW